MGSSCCRQKEDSPRMSMSKAFARLSHRIFPHSGRTVKIAEAEKRLSDAISSKIRPSVSDPVFISSTIESERNHVTLLLPDAPRIPPRKKKPRLSKKRVSFQSDVDIMSSTKSLDKNMINAVAEAKKLSKRSLESLLDAAKQEEEDTTLECGGIYHVKRLPKRRTSSLETLAGDLKWPAREEAIALLKGRDFKLTANLRRDTLGNVLDIHSYRRPVMESILDETQEEEEDGDESDSETPSALTSKLRRDTLATIRLKGLKDDTMDDLTEEEDDSTEDNAPPSLALKLRRDTLGIALLARHGSLASSEDDGAISSTEDLTKKMKCSLLCSKLRRDTFGDALRAAVRCKACSSFEDITELEIDDPKLKLLENYEDLADEVSQFVENLISRAESIVTEPKADIERSKRAWLSDILLQGEKITEKSKIPAEQNNNIEKLTKRVIFTDIEINTAKDKMKSVEKKEPYTVIFSSNSLPANKAPLPVPSIRVSHADEEISRDSSTTSSLQEFESSIYDMLQTEDDPGKKLPPNT